MNQIRTSNNNLNKEGLLYDKSECYYNFYVSENSHPWNSPLKNFHPENSHLEYSHPFMFLNIPTWVLNFFVFWLLSPSSLILLKRLFSNSVLKALKSEIQKSMYQKKLELACPSLIIGHCSNWPVCFRWFYLWSFSRGMWCCETQSA